MKKALAFFLPLAFFLLPVCGHAEDSSGVGMANGSPEQGLAPALTPAVTPLNYIPNAFSPSLENYQAPLVWSLPWTVTIPGATNIYVYQIGAVNNGDLNELICRISTFQDSANQDVWEDVGVYMNGGGDTATASLLPGDYALLFGMAVGDNGDYSFFGPVAFGGHSPCGYREMIPTLSEWGLIILTVLIMGASIVVIRRKKRSFLGAA